MKYGIYFAYWEKQWDADYLPYIEKVKSLGFDILEISLGGLKNMTKSQMDDLRNEAKRQGITLTAGYGPGPNENIASSDESISRQAIEFYTDMLQKLEYLDIHTLGGGIYSYWPIDYTKPIDKEKDWNQSVKNLKTVGRIARNCGVDYCLEVLNRFEGYLLNTADEAIKFVKEIDEPAVKVMLDTFHMNIEEDNMVEAIQKTKGLLGHFHVGENNRRCPGKGSLPWNDIGYALRSINYDGPVVMEPFVLKGGQVGRDIKIWHNQIRDEKQLDKDAKNSVSYLRSIFEGPYGDYSL